MLARGGRCWFAVDSRSFDISVEVVGGKLRGIIEERGRGFSSWIRFGDLSFRCLLKGVEFCCRDEVLARWNKSWEEGGRKFKLERHSNEAGRFLFCAVVTEEVNRFSLIFLEGRGHLGGWVVLDEKLHYLGIIPFSEVKELGSSVEVKSIPKEGIAVGSFAVVVRKDLRVVGDVVRFQLEEGEVSCREEKLRKCLVGWFEESSTEEG